MDLNNLSEATISDLLIILTALILMAGVLWTAFSSSLARNWNGHEKRAFIHIMSGNWAILWLYVDSQTMALAFTGAVVLLVGLAFFSKKAFIAQKVSELSLERESFLGIFLYGLSIFFVTAFLWDDKLIGSIALIALAIGDGCADIIGKRYGRRFYALPWAPRRSWEGTLAGGAATFFTLIIFLASAGVRGEMLFALAAAATLAECLAEGLSPNHSDNVFIPAVVVGVLLFVF